MVTWARARRFIGTYDVPAVKTLYAKVSSYDVFKTDRTKSDPRMTLIAADENYLDYMGNFDLAALIPVSTARATILSEESS